MRRLAQIAAVAALALALLPTAARAEFGLDDIQVSFLDAEDAPVTQAGSHPFAMRTAFDVNTVLEGGGEYVDGALRGLEVLQPAGLAGTPTPVPPCDQVDFLSREFLVEGKKFSNCPDSAALGYVTNTLATHGEVRELPPIPVYNLRPPPRVAAKIGFWVDDVPIAVELGVNPNPPYNVVARLAEVSQTVEVVSSELILWGNPADSAHDAWRGHCLGSEGPTGETCAANVAVRPFFTLPRSCGGALRTIFVATSWWEGSPLAPQPGSSFVGEAETPAMTGCAKLGFAPQLSAQPTTTRASSPTGLEVSLQVEDQGLINPSGLAHSDIQRAEVTLPVGVTANPSLAEGLATCSQVELSRETVTSLPGDGCPQAAKIGTVEVESPLLEGELLRGSLFIATPHENPFGTLLALYVVIRHPERGILVKLAGKVEPDPITGQLRTVFGKAADGGGPALSEIPQLPVSSFRLRLREGGRSPLISPDACGTHTTEARFVPTADPGNPVHLSSSFQIAQGMGGAPCPPAGAPPFAPGFDAGSVNANAGSHTPFVLRLTRRDGDQDLTRFDSTLPRGLVAKLAGVSQCPDHAIALSKAKTGRQELASPSCPANSLIGSLTGGAGVGSQLTYVPGSLYLAGPLGRAPLSVVAVVPAVAGPFDVGTVVVREALRIDPITAEVTVDGAFSDPIPHMLAGIPLKVRDIQVNVNRSEFSLNPTSCDPMAVGASIWGGGFNPFSRADDAPVARSVRFQAANCRALGFKPRLSIRLKGGTKRGGHPAFRAVLRPRRGDANLSKAITRLPRSAFLDQAHIRTVCTRVQFAAENCPKGAIYGHVSAFSPLLEEPLRGPAYLRSSDNLLPDLVFDLHGLFDIEATGRVDSIKGGIRVIFPRVPDAPISKVVIDMQGGRKGLIVNSRNLCRGASRATVDLEAHNAKSRKLRPAMRATGCKKRKAKGNKRRR